MLIINKLNR